MRVLVPAMAMLLIGSCTEPNPFRGICGNGVEEPDFDEQCDLGAENGGTFRLVAILNTVEVRLGVTRNLLVVQP